jgi:hypothetical protein
MFQSDKGIYLLDRAMSTRYIGDRVEDYNNLRVTSAVVLEDTNEVRFTTEGVCLVYNYYFDEWSVFNNFEAASAVSHATIGYCHLKSTGEVRVESTGYLDNGLRYSMAMETGWLSFAGVNGYQRIWYIHCLGEFVAQHYCKVMLGYNRENTFNQIEYYDSRDQISESTFGDEGPFGEGGFGEGSQAYHWRLKPRRQKCESLKIRIEDVDTITAGGGGAVSINSLSFEVGVKSGNDKKSDQRTV